MPGFEVEINGNRFTNFVAGTASKSIENLSGEFSIVATATQNSIYPIRRGDSCKIFIEDKPFINGFIESISVSGSATDHKINIQGRDKTGDVIDSTIISSPEFSPPSTLKNIIENILAANGITDISVIQGFDTKPFQAGEQVSAAVGENMFDFINKYCIKRQVLATTDGNGNIELCRVGDVFFGSGQIIHEKDNPKNNVLTFNFTDDSTNRFSEYTVKSEQNPVSLDNNGSLTSAEFVVNNKGSVSDPEIRTSRKLLIDSDTTNNSLNAGQTAAWEANVRRARGFTYNCTVRGYFAKQFKIPGLNSGVLWTVNRIVQVKDIYCDLDAALLLKSVKFNIDSSGGTTTDLEFTYRDAYSLDVVVNALKARTSETGGNYVKK